MSHKAPYHQVSWGGGGGGGGSLTGAAIHGPDIQVENGPGVQLKYLKTSSELLKEAGCNRSLPTSYLICKVH